MRTFFKKFLFKVFNTIFGLIKSKPHIHFDSISDILILIQKPLGIGDLTMLSPLIKLLEEKYSEQSIYIVTEYEKFIDFGRVKWVHPASIREVLINNKSLIVSPMLTFSHLKYIFQARYFIGYFYSNKLVSNFIKTDYMYSLVNEHYLKKILPILDALNIQHAIDNFNYPKVMLTDEISYSDSIVIAPYVNWRERQYPYSKFVLLINLLLEVSNCKIILIGSNNPVELEFNRRIEALIANSRVENQTGSTSILDMTKLINSAKLFIGNDSGPAHIAYLGARKSLVFFGSVRFEDRTPLNFKLTKKINCIDSRDHCQHFPCYDGLSKPNCINNDKYSCISNAEISREFLRDLLN